MRKLGLLAVMAASFLLAGCFEIQGVHVLHPYGESDTGGYRIKMDRTIMDQSKMDDLLRSLRTWSRPATRTDNDNNYYVEDLSGDASMEHFYDVYHCETSPQPGYADCHFGFNLPKEYGDLPNWTIDWEVVVQPGMRIINSNHQRVRQVDGRDHLIWYFDGNHTSTANVDFTVRLPKTR